jgi:hypothetical protein
VELLFSNCGDQSGVFYFIGTERKTKRWVNPCKAGFITVTCSSTTGTSRYTRPDVLVSRSFVSRNYTVGKPAWWQIDLSAGHGLVSYAKRIVMSYFNRSATIIAFITMAVRHI